MDYKTQNPEFQLRKQESTRVLQKYSDRIPVICQKSKYYDGEPISQIKYLVPNDMTIYYFNHMLRRKISIRESDALHIFINDKHTIRGDQTFECVHKKYKDADGFLYLTYSTEATFGDVW